jgi:hypothetical protein
VSFRHVLAQMLSRHDCRRRNGKFVGSANLGPKLTTVGTMAAGDALCCCAVGIRGHPSVATNLVTVGQLLRAAGTGCRAGLSDRGIVGAGGLASGTKASSVTDGKSWTFEHCRGGLGTHL